jgi:SagB-type dehydrogenase family enzyme
MLKDLFKLGSRNKNESLNTPQDAAFYYHKETKHHFNRYARSLGYLDWANQPNPFRRFEGCQVIDLPFSQGDIGVLYSELFLPAKRVLPLTDKSLARFLEFSLALSAWKEYRGERWALRINPSSGNLHPTEGYLIFNQKNISNAVQQPEQAIVCHYASACHSLEIRAEIPVEAWKNLMSDFPENSFLIGLSSIHWREAWKYGERAFRYCQHDIGHAIAALSFSARLLGWQLIVLSDVSDEEIAAILGLNRTEDFLKGEKEHPDLIAVVIPSLDFVNHSLSLPSEEINKIANISKWFGQANILSQEHQEWSIIDLVSEACKKPRTELKKVVKAKEPNKFQKLLTSQNTKFTAQQIIFQRRSAVDFDGKTEISAQDFYAILAQTMPSNNAPWDAMTWPSSVHLCIFVHRIKELLPGLYILVRDPEKVALLKEEMKSDLVKTAFNWEKPPLCPEDLPLYFLTEGNCQYLAKQVSCNQDIASDSAFSLGMIAEFEEPINQLGAWFYRRLFWETGIIGQILYLAAESIGVRATGIGCFFDDPVHGIFGFQNNKYQSLYHFTVGGAIDDKRLTTLPPYELTLKDRK